MNNPEVLIPILECSIGETNLCCIIANYKTTTTVDTYMVLYGSTFTGSQLLILCESKDELQYHFQHQTKILGENGFIGSLPGFANARPLHFKSWIRVFCVDNHAVMTQDCFDVVTNHDCFDTQDNNVRDGLPFFVDFQDCGTDIHSCAIGCTKCSRMRYESLSWDGHSCYSRWCDACKHQTLINYPKNLHEAIQQLPNISKRKNTIVTDKYTIFKFYAGCACLPNNNCECSSLVVHNKIVLF